MRTLRTCVATLLLASVASAQAADPPVLPGTRQLEPHPDLSASMVAGIDKMIPEYYKIRGWDDNGQLKPETRARLGL